MKLAKKMTSEEARAMRQRVGVEIAIDHELSACVARIMGMNSAADESLLVFRFRRIVGEVAKQFEKTWSSHESKGHPSEVGAEAMTDGATVARRKAMAEQPRTCGNCDWFDRRALKCCWACGCQIPIWAGNDQTDRYRGDLCVASNCKAWKPSEAADVAAEAQRKEDPCKT
jgi:hypothetical protein